MIQLRLPRISDNNERESLIQIKSYLFQLIPELQLALNEFDLALSKIRKDLEGIHTEITNIKDKIKVLETNVNT